MPATLGEHLKRWADQLLSSSDSARLDVEILFKHASGLDDIQLITRDREPLEASLLARVDALILKRRQGWPVAHLTGQREFYSLLLKVNSQVLIPRPETELLVDTVLEKIKDLASPRVLDLGTGSGAISLAIAHHAPQARVLACDSQEPALEIAEQNARKHLLENIRFLLSNWYEQLMPGDRFDLIASNPPYIDPQDCHLEQGDLRFEPRGALVSGECGLADLRRIIKGAPAYLVEGGYLVLEHGYDQGNRVRQLLVDRGFTGVCTLQDLNRLDRVTLARKVAPDRTS